MTSDVLGAFLTYIPTLKSDIICECSLSSRECFFLFQDVNRKYYETVHATLSKICEMGYDTMMRPHSDLTCNNTQ